MFREITRKKQILSTEECKNILQEQKRGVLSVITEDGYPYGMPINHYYDEENNCIWMHGGKSGHKIDCLKENNRVSYCVYDEGYRNEKEWWLNIRSVIVFGRMEMIDDYDTVIDIARKLSYRFTEDETYIQDEIAKSAKGTLLLKLNIEHMSGKSVREK